MQSAGPSPRLSSLVVTELKGDRAPRVLVTLPEAHMKALAGDIDELQCRVRGIRITLYKR